MRSNVVSTAKKIARVLLPILLLGQIALASTADAEATPEQDGWTWTRLTFYDCLPNGFCGHTYSGLRVTDGHAACDRSRLGWRVIVAGDPTGRVYTCTDTGSLVRGNHVDVWFYRAADGWRWQAAVGSYGWVKWIPPGAPVYEDETPATVAATHEEQVSVSADDSATAQEVEVRESELPAPASPRASLLAPPARVSISWQAVAGDVSEYRVYRTQGGPFELVGTTSDTTFEDTTVQMGATYRYQITAVDSLGLETVPSAQVGATVRSPVPGPQGLTAHLVGSPQQVYLTWEPAPERVAQYRVYRSSGGAYELIGTTRALKFEDTTAVTGITYRYYVTALDSVGLETNPSGEAVVRLPDPS